MTFRTSPHSLLDKKFKPLLEKIRIFQTSAIDWIRLPSGEEKERLRPILVREYEALIDEAPLAERDRIAERESDLAFASGVMRALHLERTIVDDIGILDTFGSDTLHHFCTDYRNGQGDDARVHKALLQSLNLNAEELSKLRDEFTKKELLPLDKRKRVIEAIDKLFDLNNKGSLRKLFYAFYPGFELNTTEINLIRTASSIFFCIDFEKVAHLTIREAKQSSDPLGRLWGNFLSRKQGYMAHFPVFGFFKGEHVDGRTLKKIAEQSGLDSKTCEDLLTTMVSILPKSDVDQYIIHDIWGHQWQAHLFTFEDTYKSTAGFKHAPDIRKIHDNVSIEILISDKLDQHSDTMWEKRCENFLALEYEERLIDSITSLFAEVLADAMEYKFLFLRQDLQEKMPSSSFLSNLPAKLDLTLHDLPIYFRLAFRGIASLEKEKVKEQWVNTYLSLHPSADEKKVIDSVNTITIIARDLVGAQTSFTFQDASEERVIMNAHAQIAFQFFELVQAFNSIFLSENIHAIQSEVFPRHFDLLVFSTAAFYERDRKNHFWKIDSFLREAFPPRYKKFQESLSNL